MGQRTGACGLWQSHWLECAQQEDFKGIINSIAVVEALDWMVC